MFDASGGDEFVGDFLDGGGLTANDEDLQAVVVVEMDVEGGDDDLVMIVLDVSERGLDVLFVMVVQQGDGAGDFLVAEVLAVLDEAGANHVGYGQGAVVIALLAGHLVELFGQRARDGNREADDAIGLSSSHGADLNRAEGLVNRRRHRVSEF